MTKGEGKKKLTLKNIVLLLVGAVLIGVGAWFGYERYFYVDSAIKGSLEFWDRFNKETVK